MKDLAIRTYIGAMALVAIACLTLLPWQDLATVDPLGLGSLIALGILAEMVAISVTIARSVGYSSITFIPFLASVLLFGPAAGVLAALSIKVIGEFVLHQKPRRKAVFNIAQWVVGGTVSAALYYSTASSLGHEPSNFVAMLKGGAISVPFSVLTVSFFVMNYVLVSGAIALDKKLPVRKVVRLLSSAAGANLLFGLLISPIALVVAILYVHLEVGGIFFALLPLIFIRRSYVNNIKLQTANRDLLKALVKAIETRDPYTSGHSLRVSILARRIGSAMGLSKKRLEQVETAALLHDIGKIEAVYTDILRKPSTLSAKEREVIESHVTKGVELLESLSSFPQQIILDVRHHHEREDGKGYPDGLIGDDIPTGAKIIKICDAIDAMLSDRPYRKALTLAEVREQLVIYAGTQFDIGIVGVVVRGSIIEEHREDVAVSPRTWPTSMTSGDPADVGDGNEDLAVAIHSVFATEPTNGQKLEA